MQSADKVAQQVGISSSFLSASTGNKQSILMAILQPTKQTKDNVHFKLTPPIIQQIFVEFPEVRVAYKRNVPDKVMRGKSFVKPTWKILIMFWLAEWSWILDQVLAVALHEEKRR